MVIQRKLHSYRINNAMCIRRNGVDETLKLRTYPIINILPQIARTQVPLTGTLMCHNTVVVLFVTAIVVIIRSCGEKQFKLDS